MLDNFSLTAPIGLSFNILLVLVFTFFFATFQYDPEKISENFKKNGTFIPGVKPGEETRKYIFGVLMRISIPASIYLSLISSIGYILQIAGLPPQITIGGTSIIILVTVPIETIGQLQERSKTTRLSKIKINNKNKDTVDTGGLLW